MPLKTKLSNEGDRVHVVVTGPVEEERGTP